MKAPLLDVVQSLCDAEEFLADDRANNLPRGSDEYKGSEEAERLIGIVRRRVSEKLKKQNERAKGQATTARHK